MREVLIPVSQLLVRGAHDPKVIARAPGPRSGPSDKVLGNDAEFKVFERPDFISRL